MSHEEIVALLREVYKAVDSITDIAEDMDAYCNCDNNLFMHIPKLRELRARVSAIGRKHDYLQFREHLHAR